MRSFLVFLYGCALVFSSFSALSSSPDQGNPQRGGDSLAQRQAPVAQRPAESPEQWLARFARHQPAPDHPILIGEPARDPGAMSAIEHLTPLILMVMAFLISFIAACLWMNRRILLGSTEQEVSPPGIFRKSVVVMSAVSAALTLLACCILMNLWNQVGGHEASHEEKSWFYSLLENHHLIEIIFGLLALASLIFVLLYLWWNVRPASTYKLIKVLFWILLLISLVLFGAVLIHVNYLRMPPEALGDWILLFLISFLILLCFFAIVFGIFVLYKGQNWRVSYPGLRAILFNTALLQLMVVLILLNIFPDYYYKLCHDNCLMRGSHAGTTFDLPCSDNIAFMVHHQTGDRTDFEEYLEEHSTGLPLFMDYATPVAMHAPLFPKPDENIVFTLTESYPDRVDGNSIKECKLYVRDKPVIPGEVLSGFAFGPINTESMLKATWKRNGVELIKTVSGQSTVVKEIMHDQRIPGTAGKVTYVTYKFEIDYVDPIKNPHERMEITFVLQNFHTYLPSMPAPVYAQGNMLDVMDVLFIPANRAGETVATEPSFIDAFHRNCRIIIKDAIFREPSLKFWRKQFNFWINKEHGQVADASCPECCHTLPTNLDNLGMHPQFDFKALLHAGTNWDFTDACKKAFSAEMELVNDENEKSSFLHEMGHAVFWLADEYPGGYNIEATMHLPNNWRTLRRARADAPLRHKTHDDAQRLH